MGLDAEVAELHAHAEESWLRIENLTAQLRALPAADPQSDFGTSASTASQMTTAAARAGIGEGHIPQETLDALRKMQADFQVLQQQAFRIGRESRDNDALSKHPDVNDYIQNLR